MKWLWLLWFTAAAVLEWAAIRFSLPTLSQTVVDLDREWPPFRLVLGFVLGAIVSHWFWPLKGD